MSTNAIFWFRFSFPAEKSVNQSEKQSLLSNVVLITWEPSGICYVIYVRQDSGEGNLTLVFAVSTVVAADLASSCSPNGQIAFILTTFPDVKTNLLFRIRPLVTNTEQLANDQKGNR